MIEQLKTIRSFIIYTTNWPSVEDRNAAHDAIEKLEAMMEEQESSFAFYKRRCDALQQWQSKMRDPERTVVCDILANGCTLEPAGNRYAAPLAQQHETVTNDEQARAYMDARLWEFIDMAGMWPKAKPDPRIWAHVMVYAPPAQQYEAGDMTSAAAQGFRDGVASVTQQEPVAWAMPKGDGTFIDVITPAEHAREEGSYTVPLFAHPAAQQPQAEAVPVVDRVYEAAKRLVDHADFQLGGVLSAKSKARDIPSNAASKVKARHLASLRDALAKTPQQAEAVPPTHVLVPVEPDEMWAYQVIRHHQPDLEVGGTAWLECLKEMLHWHAAIAQQKGQKP